MPMTQNTIAIPRDLLHRSHRPSREQAPLLRGETSDHADHQTLKVPMPEVLTEDEQDIRVLHVDDNPEYTELTKTFLERDHEELRVATETSAVAGLNRLNNEQFDCVVSDYDMPNTDGLEFLQLVRETHPDLPFILFTGAGDEDIASKAIRAGVTDYVKKRGGSEQYEVLANRIDNAVDRYRTQQRFWDALSWYERLVEQDLVGVFIIQGDEFIFVNERFANIFGCEQADFIGTSPTELDCSDSQTEFTTLFDHRWNDAEFSHEVTITRRDNAEKTVEIHGGPVQCAGEPGCIGLVWDKDAQGA